MRAFTSRPPLPKPTYPEYERRHTKEIALAFPFLLLTMKTPSTRPTLPLKFTVAALVGLVALLSSYGSKGWLGGHPAKGGATVATAPLRKVEDATKELPYVNSLGMQFVPVAGTRVLFSIWDTRVQDYRCFAKETGRDWTAGFTETKRGRPLVEWDWTQTKICAEYYPFLTKLFSGDRTEHIEPGPMHPAVNVSWGDAKAFCAWLTMKERKAGRVEGNKVYRLPTDEEWSLAAGLPAETGSTPMEKDSKVEGVYPWGTKWPPAKGTGNYYSSANTDDYDYTSPVGSFPANQYGLYDMGGNVWQWCQDLFTVEDKSRVARGGSWQEYDPYVLLSSFRGRSNPERSSSNYGFRCVLAPSGR